MSLFFLSVAAVGLEKIMFVCLKLNFNKKSTFSCEAVLRFNGATKKVPVFRQVL